MELQEAARKARCATRTAVNLSAAPLTAAGRKCAHVAFHSLSCDTAVNLHVGLDAAGGSMAEAQARLESAAKAQVECWARGVLTIDGALQPNDMTLSALSTGNEHAVQILAPGLAQALSPGFEDGPATVTAQLVGRVRGQAVVHERATVGEAVEALLADLANSLRVRLAMQCEVLLASNPDITPSSVRHSVPEFSAVLNPMLPR